ncbi:MAG: hypothetical protein QOK48_1814 [Blastocatellia bacterium]|jgi:hypothetical protein|nr:hypothetical protein [Blastocatellia bacterium]
MKRCPKCNRTYTTDTQKFCTHDGGILDTVDMSSETVRIDSQNAPTQAISAGLGHDIPAQFDPFKTVISRPETVQPKPRDTQGIEPPPVTVQPTPAPPPPPPAQPPAPPDDMMRTMASIPPPSQAPPPPIAATPPSPPPVAPQQPTQRLVGSGPIASAPLPAPPLVQSQPVTTAPAKPAKKSKLPLIFGILVVLLVLGAGGLGAAYFFVLRPMLEARKVPVPSTPPAETPTPIVQNSPTEGPKATPAPEPPPYSAPADAVEFVSSKANLDGKLAEHFVDFSFYYPNRWLKDSTAGVPGATNFAKVERRLPPDLTQENFAVGSYVSAGSPEDDRAAFHTVADNLSSQFAKKFPEYKKVSEGETKVGVYSGYGFRFESISRNTDRGNINVWGRVIFLPPVDGSRNGVVLLMLATSLAPELRSVDDVGVKGELPMMLESFRFGKK